MDLSQIMWRTSTRTTNGADCVQVGALSNIIAIRDSKNPGGAMLVFSRDEFARFADRLKRTEAFTS
jgi:hypothetical protein